MGNNLLLTTTDLPLEELKAKQSDLPQDSDWGIDTVALSIPVQTDVPELAHNSWYASGGELTEAVDKSKWYSNFKVGWANVYVSYKPLYGSIYVQFCAPKVLAPSSTALLPPNALGPLVEKSLVELVSQIPVLPTCMTIDDEGSVEFITDWKSHVKISRIDCARNFQITNQEYLQHALAKTVSKSQKVAHVYWSKTGWTRSNMTKNEGMDRMYDKSKELLNHELDEQFKWEKGIYRFEAELKKSRLTKTGLTTLDRVTDEAVWNALNWRWEQSNWGIVMPGTGSIGELIGGLKDDQRLKFVGYLALAAQGLSELVDAKEARRMSRLAELLKLTPGADIGEYGVMNHLLSLWHGQEVEFRT
ncbi:MAG: hypothetical protein RIS08_153 [Actinomycetota bacterium]